MTKTNVGVCTCEKHAAPEVPGDLVVGEHFPLLLVVRDEPKDRLVHLQAALFARVQKVDDFPGQVRCLVAGRGVFGRLRLEFIRQLKSAEQPASQTAVGHDDANQGKVLQARIPVR